VSDDYPKQLVHPDFCPAILSVGSAAGHNPGRPARFPSVMVHSPDQEERERARGYLAPGEPRPKVSGYFEYPMMMEHPDHQPEVKEYLEGREIDGKFTTFTVPGKPGRWPAVVANTPEEAELWREKGYVSGGHADARSFERIKAGVSADHIAAEWPKVIDGKLVQDPNLPRSTEKDYPMWLADLGVTVNSAAEHLEALGRGSSKNEPVKRAEPETAKPASADAEYQEFLEWKARRASREFEAVAVNTLTSGPAELDLLRARATALGIKWDKRWGEKKFTAEIARIERETATVELEEAAAE
jgi:hypothetical protein